MRILMRNTVFKTAALAGLFLCMLAFAGAFSGITTSVHAVHADEVDTQEELEQFVQEAVDAYYVDFLIREHCDFTQISALANFQDLIPDLSTLPVEGIKQLIPLFSNANLFPPAGLTRADIDEGCDFSHRFAEVFGRGEGEWKSGPIYLFIMNTDGEMLYHGADQSLEGNDVVAVDEAGQNVRELIVDEAENPMNAGIVKYCWDNPATDSDNIDDNDLTTAPGDSLKISYVVDPFEHLGAPALSDDPGIIFASGIYPSEMDSELPECDGNGMADGGEQMEEMMEEEMEETMEEEMEETMEEMEETEEVEDVVEDVVDSVSGGGCAIAAGSDSTSRNNALNLLLIVSALFFAVSFGNRAVGRRNGSSS